MGTATRPYEKLGDCREMLGFESREYPPKEWRRMKAYGYKSSISKSLKIRKGGICYCCCCMADERAERKNKRKHRKRARRYGKLEIKRQLSES